MLRNLFTKLIPQSQKGFSHHLLLPLVAVLAVGGIGAYLTFGSKAATACPPPSTHAIGYGGQELCVYPKYTGYKNGEAYCKSRNGVGGYASQKLSDGMGDYYYKCSTLPSATCPSGWDKYVTTTPIGSERWSYGWICSGASSGGGGGGGGGGSSTCPSSRPTVAQGSSLSACVRIIQRAVGVSQDGIFGPGTKAAVISYQKKYGLTADGIVGPGTWAKIDGGGGGGGDPKPPSPPPISTKCDSPHPTVKEGSNGGCVAHAQDMLTKSGFETTVDGNFGSGTKSSVVSFQKWMRMTADGIVGSDTWYALHNAASNKVAPNCPLPHPGVKSDSSPGCIAHVQDQITKAGFAKLARTGRYDSATKKGVQAFQLQFYGNDRDGTVDSNEWGALHYAAKVGTSGATRNCPSPHPAVKPGSYGDCVAHMQDQLDDAKFGDIEKDGMFGATTYWAVRAFQKKYGFPETGTLEASQWTKLHDAARGK